MALNESRECDLPPHELDQRLISYASSTLCSPNAIELIIRIILNEGLNISFGLEAT